MFREKVRMLLVITATSLVVGCGWSSQNTTPDGSSPYGPPLVTSPAGAQGANLIDTTPPTPPPGAPVQPVSNPTNYGVAPASGYAPGSTTRTPIVAERIPSNPYPPQAATPGVPYASPGFGSNPLNPQPPIFGGPQQAAEFEPAKILAQVGDQYILAGDVQGMVTQILAPHRDKMNESQYKEQTQRLMQEALNRAVESKLMYMAFLREIPAERRDEALPQIRRRLYAEYDEKELEKAMKLAKVNGPAEFDAKLRTFGSSLSKQKQSYLELKLGRAAVAQSIDINPVISHSEMLDYYHQNLADYEFPARARWEKLTVRFDKTPDRRQAGEMIVALGNEVLLGGAKLNAVARRSSQGLDASDGGLHDWTSQGSLRSKALDTAIFQLPPAYLSEIIEDETGLHIVRVIQRQPAGRTPFLEAQVEIKEKLRQQKRKSQIQKFVADLKNSIYVWTVYDDSAANASTNGSTVGQAAPAGSGGFPPRR